MYPQSQIQRCVIPMLRNSFKYVNYSDLKKFSSDFKEVYHAPNETVAYSELEGVKEKWGRKYPYAIRNSDKTLFIAFINCYILSSKSPQTFENTKFITSEFALTFSLVLYPFPLCYELS